MANYNRNADLTVTSYMVQGVLGMRFAFKREISQELFNNERVSIKIKSDCIEFHKGNPNIGFPFKLNGKDKKAFMICKESTLNKIQYKYDGDYDLEIKDGYAIAYMRKLDDKELRKSMAWVIRNLYVYGNSVVSKNDIKKHTKENIERYLSRETCCDVKINTINHGSDGNTYVAKIMEVK